MALLNNLFDILRGWPGQGAIDDTFPVHVSGGTPDTLIPGTVVTIQPDGSMAAASTPNRSSADALLVWVVISGNTDFDGQFLEKVVCLQSNAEFRLDPANFASGSYSVGSPLSFVSGQWTLATTNNQIIGQVLVDNRAVDGTMNVFYTGGTSAGF